MYFHKQTTLEIYSFSGGEDGPPGETVGVVGIELFVYCLPETVLVGVCIELGSFLHMPVACPGHGCART